MITSMLHRMPARYGHFVFAVVQSAITAAVASAITSARLAADDFSIVSLLGCWLISWATMVPIVLLAAPAIRRLVLLFTRSEKCEPR
jgi:hypothetical protein